jgi:hypothetical protein
MSGSPDVVHFTLSCHLLSGREIMLDGQTQDSNVLHISKQVAKVLRLNRQVHQVFLVKGVHVVAPFSTLRDCGITAASVKPFLNVVVTSAPPLLSAELYQWSREMDVLRRSWKSPDHE